MHREVKLLTPHGFTQGALIFTTALVFLSMVMLPAATNQQLRHRWPYCCLGICAVVFIHNFFPWMLPTHLEASNHECLWRLAQRVARRENDPDFLEPKGKEPP